MGYGQHKVDEEAGDKVVKRYHIYNHNLYENCEYLIVEIPEGSVRNEGF